MATHAFTGWWNTGDFATSRIGVAVHAIYSIHIGMDVVRKKNGMFDGFAIMRTYRWQCIWDLIIYPAIVITSFIFYVRLMKLISINDLESYFETTPSLKVTLKRILIS